MLQQLLVQEMQNRDVWKLQNYAGLFYSFSSVTSEERHTPGIVCPNVGVVVSIQRLFCFLLWAEN